MVAPFTNGFRCLAAAALVIAVLLLIGGCSHSKSAGTLGGDHAAPPVKWEFDASGGFVGALALADDGTVYAAGSDGTLYAVHPDGQLAWKRTLGPPIVNSPLIAPDGTVYVVNAGSRVIATNPNGTEQWHSDLPGIKNAYDSGSAIDGTWLYTSARHGLCALRLSDGEVQWETAIPFAQWGEPVILGNGLIVYPGHGRLNAIDTFGRRRWEYPVLTDEMIEKNGGWPPPANVGFTGPVVGADGTIYATTASSKILALNGDGTLQWEFVTPTGNRTPPALAADGTVYFESTNATLYALDGSGHKKWDLFTQGTGLTSPLLAEDGTVYIGGSKFYAVSPEGKLLWAFDTKDHSTLSPTLAADGTLYVATTKGKLFAFATTGGGLMRSAWPKFQRDLHNSGAITSR